MTDIERRLADLIRAARRGIAFTGAGMSTESGIPDFRSPGGLWMRVQPVMYDDFMVSRARRVEAWKLGAEMFRVTSQARPNAGHLAITALQARGYLAAVVTQNIDGLHQEAGSGNVVELHGTNRRASCQHCGKEWPMPDIVARVVSGDEAPECDDCGGPIKSKTISFGQAMPQQAMRLAAEYAEASDLCLALGSSLVVEPAASIPRLAKATGAKLVILNNQPTPLDGMADLVIHRPLGETLQAVLRMLEDD